MADVSGGERRETTPESPEPRTRDSESELWLVLSVLTIGPPPSSGEPSRALRIVPPGQQRERDEDTHHDDGHLGEYPDPSSDRLAETPESRLMLIACRSKTNLKRPFLQLDLERCVRMVDPELLEILVCPETHQPVRSAGAEVLERLNGAIRSGGVTNRHGDAVSEPIDEGLIREDDKVLYPVRDDIPIMLIDEAIELDALG